MPRLYTYIDENILSLVSLRAKLSAMRDDGDMSSGHVQTILHAIEPLLPCRVRIGFRTPKSIVYCEAGDKQFRVGQRAEFRPGPWPQSRAGKKCDSLWR
jgi:hypothetical protein